MLFDGSRNNVAFRSKVFVISVIGAIAPIAAARNLILNDSFESPTITSTHILVNSGSGAISNWSVSGPGNTVVHHSPTIGNALGNQSFNGAHHGENYLDLSGSGSPHAVVSQAFSTSIGQQYELSFWIGASNQQAPAATIHVQLDGAATLFSSALTPSAPLVNINWTLQSFNFVADSSTTTLRFQGLSAFDDNASFVDSVSVVLVPEPVSGFTLVAGTLLLSLRRRLT